MAQDGWIKLRYDLAGHSNVRVLAATCDVKENEALGALARYWIAVARLPDYDPATDTAFFAKGVTEKAIDGIAGLSGFAHCIRSLSVKGRPWLEFDEARQQFCVGQVDKWINSEVARKNEAEKDATRKRQARAGTKAEKPVSDGCPADVQRMSDGNPENVSYLSLLDSSSLSSVSGRGAGETTPTPGHAVCGIGLHNRVWDAWSQGGVLPAHGKSRAGVLIGEAIGIIATRKPHSDKATTRAALESAAEWLAETVTRWRESPFVKAKCPGWSKYPANWFDERRYDDDPAAWNNASSADNGRGQQPTVAQRADAGKYRRNGEQAGTPAPGVSGGAGEDGTARVVNW